MYSFEWKPTSASLSAFTGATGVSLSMRPDFSSRSRASVTRSGVS